ncbi:MAG: xanthine phosphoribosyltransferase [Firmicutes bacterium]|nr:xanthine phosphoribosyltransferase [Bacillota bacterium]
MQALKERIVQDGFALGTEIVKVDSFLNHQIDVAFLQEIGREFKARFSGLQPTKILTMEASGIAVAAFTAMAFGNIPVVFAKKAAPNTMTEDVYAAEVKSFTKGTVSLARVAKKYLGPQDRILIIDDFLAHGEAGMGLISLVEQAGAELLGFGAVIEKAFQGGGRRIRQSGCRLESLAVIEKIENGTIHFL